MEQKLLVAWRDQNFVVEMKPGATLKDLGIKLQSLTNVKADTIRLLLPMGKSSKLLYPFAEENANLSLDSMLVVKGKPIRMLGVPKEEVDEILQNARIDYRIAGFSEEERRLNQRSSGQANVSVKLPRGTYIFCDFRPLNLLGMELSPPVSKALELLHKLASDPGIVAIMNKYRWRVGILTEMAPVGYVGVSPECILGVNKNHGEEISLRLRTDDLKGFRKYERIKETLLHELAHMVYSEHDSNFYAFDKQLNREATALDWTKSRSHTLSRPSHGGSHEAELGVASSVASSQKLGGHVSNLPDARSAAADVALQRFASTSLLHSRPSEEQKSTAVPSQNVFEPELDEYQEDQHMAPDNVSEIHHDGGVRSQSVVEFDQMDSSIASGPESETESGMHAEAAQIANSLPKSQGPDVSNPELQIIQDPVSIFYRRLESSVQLLKDELKPSVSETVLQTLIKIICNVVKNPDDLKFKRLRKGNPTIQRNIVAHKAAVDILTLIGFREDTLTDEWGNTETFLILKRDDPGLLWLAKSSLEAVQ